jgi:hypothetical protein
MRIKEVAAECLYDSGARGIHGKAEEVALVGFMVAPAGEVNMREFRRDIRSTYLKLNQECGSFFLIFVLPILISLISNWIAKWILNHTTQDLKEMRSQAFDSLAASSPESMARLTSTNSPPKNKTTP